jgi:hypothetical protein
MLNACLTKRSFVPERRDGTRPDGAVVGSGRVMAGTVSMSASLVQPGKVRLRSANACMTFGEVHGGPGARVPRLADDLQKGLVGDNYLGRSTTTILAG